MKKVSLLILLCIYTISTFGIGIREFYCCGKLASIHFSFIQEAKEKNAKGESDKNNCCKTTHKFFKVKDTHKGASDPSGISSPVVCLPQTAPVFTSPLFSSTPITAGHAANGPPGDRLPIYLSNRVFRI